MQMLYNSDSFVVVQFEPHAEGGDAPQVRGGFEIVDKLARKEIFIEGALAEAFAAGVQQLVEAHTGPEAFDEYFARYTTLAQQPVVMH